MFVMNFYINCEFYNFRVMVMEARAMELANNMEQAASRVHRVEAGASRAVVGVAPASSGALHIISSSSGGGQAMALEAKVARGGRGVITGVNIFSKD